MDRIFQAGLIMVIGVILLPVVKLILDELNENMIGSLYNTTGITSFETAVMDAYPVAILVAVFVAAALTLRRSRKSNNQNK